ncbi:MAG: pilus assembly PilX family protein [Desulfobulbaceae bacterium]|jgi:hypothetical protein
MKLPRNTVHGEDGFVLVMALLVMLVLTIIGIAATTNTSIELQIAGNDKVHKRTFYEAEAGAILGSEVLEQAFSCPVGFAKTSTVDSVDVADLTGTVVRVYDRDNDLVLYHNEYPDDTIIGDITKADAAYPLANLASGEETGYLYFGGETQMLAGGALQMAAGYEGKGKSAGQGGSAKIFDIYSQFRGLVNSESIVMFGWMHLVGMEGDCNYD